MDDAKKKALGAALSQIEKQFGKGSVMRMGDTSAVREVEAGRGCGRASGFPTRYR